MKGLLKIYRRYLGTAIGLVILFVFINLAALMVLMANTLAEKEEERFPVMRFRATAEQIVEKTQEGYALSEEGKAYLTQTEAVFAMLLDENTGEILFSWNLPENLNHRYDLADVASFARWYLEDYPMKVWDTELGLLAVGNEKGTQAKYSLTWERSDMETLARAVPVILWVDIGAILIILFVMSRKFHKSLLPINYGIEKLSEGTAVNIHPKGVVKEVGEQLNRISLLLEKQKKDIARRDTARTEWIAGVSHDIRTPLSMILGYAEDLEESGNLTERERNQAKIIKEQSIRIRQLIEDLNLTSKLAYEMQPLRVEAYRPAVLLRRVVAEFLNREEDEGYELELDMDRTLEQTELLGDVQLLERALRNLIQNSIRHNPQGCRITVKCRQEGENILISVADTGKGIPLSVRESILGEKEPPKGVHIMGLRIVQQIVKSHKGRLNITQDGQEVEVYLPIKRED